MRGVWNRWRSYGGGWVVGIIADVFEETWLVGQVLLPGCGPEGATDVGE